MSSRIRARGVVGTINRVINITLTSNIFNYNLSTVILNHPRYKRGRTTVNFTNNAIISSISETFTAFTIEDTLRQTDVLNVINNGFIIGRGGTGGRGGALQNRGESNHSVTSGSNGGRAILISRSVNITNNGTIGGGGGGGGGAASGEHRTRLFAESVTVATGSGGGGGAGISFGGFGSATVSGSRTARDARNGADGTFNVAGTSFTAFAERDTRSFGGSTTARSSARGGFGGGLGSNGTTGSVSGNRSIPPAGGGIAGIAVTGNNLVNWISQGTILGSRV